MGSVWRAEHLDLGTPAAVKLIDESFAQSPEALTRFRREAQAAASLRSANVVQILDYGIDGETPFIAMELLIGESLADRIERQGRLEPTHCVEILLQVSKALHRAHDMGIVHRDLKPDNVFLVRDGDDEIAKVLDFGIAKRTGALQTSSDMATRTGSLMGTPYYMSPEQASGRRQVDQRTDIWAFAVIAYECVTGRRPFDDTNLGGLLLSICTENPAPASQFAPLPATFDAWFDRCTAKDPTARYENIRTAAAELCRAVGIAMPTSRLFASSQTDGVGGAAHAATPMGTGGWAGSRLGSSAATPGAVIVTHGGLDAVTLARTGNRRPPTLLLATGLIAALGIVSAIGAFIWRNTTADSGAVADASASAKALAQPSVTSTQPASSSEPIVLAVTPVPSATVAAIPSAAQASTAQAPTPKPSAQKAAVGPRAPLRRVPGRESDSANTPRMRPQDRLERDLGF